MGFTAWIGFASRRWLMTSFGVGLRAFGQASGVSVSPTAAVRFDVYPFRPGALRRLGPTFELGFTPPMQRTNTALERSFNVFAGASWEFIQQEYVGVGMYAGARFAGFAGWPSALVGLRFTGFIDGFR